CIATSRKKREEPDYSPIRQPRLPTTLLLCSLHELYKALERSWTGTGCGPHMIPQELPGETWSTSWDPWRETWSTSWAPWRETWSTSWGPWSTSWGPWSTSWGPWRDLEHFLGPLERFLGPLERFLGQGTAAKASRTSQAFPSPNRFKQLYRGRMNSGLLDPVQDLPLHAVLQLSPPHHQVQNLEDGVLRVLLQGEESGSEPGQEEESGSEPGQGEESGSEPGQGLTNGTLIPPDTAVNMV
uniref:Uncharacterized protein n=1 Tax=Gadus morhua TaxID=8049 RepID=A0A8C5ANG0_GADMO